MLELKYIRVHKIEGKRIRVTGREILIQCNDGTEYVKLFPSEAEALGAHALIAIYPSEWKQIS
jgi:hypothetical protein